GGGFPVGDGFAVFEFAFGHVPAVGVDGRGQGRGGLRDRRGRFGNDRRGVRQRFERFVRALARAARIRRGDSEVVGRVRRETRDRCGHGDRARPRPRQRGAGGGFAVGGRFAVFEFAFFDVPAVRVDRRVQCHRGLRDGRGGLRFDRRGAVDQHPARADIRVVGEAADQRGVAFPGERHAGAKLAFAALFFAG